MCRGSSSRASCSSGPGSNAITLTGNVIASLPLSVTRDSLRPYFTAGVGVLHAGGDDLANTTDIDRNLLAVSVGGGAIGFLNARAGRPVRPPAHPQHQHRSGHDRRQRATAELLARHHRRGDAVLTRVPIWPEPCTTRVS